MLYLEDYLEMIEHLPQELRDRFTEMREMDLSVQNSMDSLEKRVKIFFGNAKRLKPTEKDMEHESIRKEYYKTLEDADEKVHLANQMYELVHRYLRRLDAELFKFKIELEADNSGITEVLEKRSLELDQPQLNSVSREKENRFSLSSRASNAHGDSCGDRETTRYIKKEKRRDSNASSTGAEKRQAVDKCSGGGPVAAPLVLGSMTALAPDTRPGSAGTAAGAGGAAGGAGGATVSAATAAATAAAAAAALTQMQPLSGATSPGVAYSLGHIGAGGNAIAAAASQAIAATQQMQQGRRTASLKASYEAINTGVHAHEFSIGRELAGAAQTALAAIQHETTKKHKKSHHRKSGTSGGSSSSSVQASALTTLLAPNSPAGNLDETSLAGATDDDGLLDPSGDGDADWTYDPNEPRYCLCNQVSYGDMVACDNQDCPLEWFHYPCVGITAPPKGKWYCPQCSSAMRRRGSRKN